MKVIICGDRDADDFNFLIAAISAAKKEGIEITEIVSGGARGADELGEQYARMHDIEVKVFEAKWNDISAPDALIKVNNWGKKYNAKAGFARNEEMACYAEAVIALQPNGPTPGTKDMIDRAHKHNLKIYVHSKEKKPLEEEISF